MELQNWPSKIKQSLTKLPYISAMPQRKTILISLAAVIAVANIGWLTASQSAKYSHAAIVPDEPFRNPFPNASQLRLFVETDYDPNHKPEYSLPQGRILTDAQRAEFESLITVHTIRPDEAFAGCFVPHHFFRYFDKAGKLVGEVAVCFCCGGVEQSERSNVLLGDDQMLSADFGKLEAFVATLGERTDVQC